MAGFFDSIPALSVIMFAIGVVGIMVYERAKSRKDAQKTT
jgi:NADH:ubiquinone oxidoreductase subunit K